MKDLISLDSLTDIVSNSVGILIIFAVINLIHDNNKTYQLEIPLEHATNLSPVFFICKDERIIHMDTDILFANAAQQATQGATGSKRIFPLDYKGLFGKIDREKGISFYVNNTSQWPRYQEIKKSSSSIREKLSSLDPEKHFAYFFVFDSSNDDSVNASGFESFRKAREYLKLRFVKSGWQPVNAESPPHICDLSFNPRCVYQPSYLGN